MFNGYNNLDIISHMGAGSESKRYHLKKQIKKLLLLDERWRNMEQNEVKKTPLNYF